MGIDPVDARRSLVQQENGMFARAARDSVLTLCDGTDRAFASIDDGKVAEVRFEEFNLDLDPRHDGVPMDSPKRALLGRRYCDASGGLVLSPGEAMLLYTDGVTEAMDLGETLYSDERLGRFLASKRDSGPRQIADDLITDVKKFRGVAPQSDDITTLALHYFGTTKKMTEHVEIKLKNKLSELERFNQSLAEFGRRQGLGSKVMHDLNLALEEILTNIISYGYTDDREHEIKVHLSTQPGAVNAEVEDDGRPFNPLEAPEPDTTKPLEGRSIGGLGIQLVRKLMDGLEYKRLDDRNLLTIKKKT